MSKSISNRNDIIDSRDVIERIAELTDERDELAEAVEEAEGVLTDAVEESGDDGTETEEEELETAKAALAAWVEADGEELADLESLADGADGYCDDWKHGAVLIRDSYFEDYARELAEDIGAVDSNAPWPNTCIDWEKAAEELQQDYTSVEFGGVTYWVR